MVVEERNIRCGFDVEDGHTVADLDAFEGLHAHSNLLLLLQWIAG